MHRRLWMVVRRVGLAVVAVTLLSAAAFAAGRDDDKKPPVTPSPQPNYTLISSAFSHPPSTPDERALAVLERITKTAPHKFTTADVIDLYNNIHYESVRTLPEHGMTIKGRTFKFTVEQSRALAILRDHMINEAYRDLARDFGMDFVRLDFGNKLSGVKSDVDHTAYTDFRDVRFAGKDIRAEFERRFQARWQISQTACDICVHSGRNSIPDWRGAESVRDFDARMVEVLRGLAGTPDAYVAEGAWRQQVEMRSLNGAKEVLANLQAIEEEFKKQGLTAEQAAALEKRRAEVTDKNPCTKFRPDAKAKGGVEVSKDASILGELFRGVQGDVLRMYAFDVTIGNFLFHIHHENKLDCTKYVLRAFEEGVSLLRAIPQGETLKPLEYSKLKTDQDKANLIAQLFPDTLDGRPGYSAEQRAQIKRILDIANKLRENHKAPGSPPHTEQAVWGEMIAHLQKRSGGRAVSAEELRKLAELEYDRSSTEVMVWYTQRTTGIRTTAWLEPRKLTPADVRILQAISPGATTEKLQHSGFYALKYAFACLPEAHVDRIIQGAPPEHRKDLAILREVVRTEIELYGKVNIQPDTAREKSLRERISQAYTDVKKGWAERYADFRVALRNEQFTDEAINSRIWQTLYEHLGFEYTISRNGLEQDLPKWTGQWDARAAFRLLVNEGNVLSALNVARVYQQGGDSDAVIGALIWEGLYRIPGLLHLMAVRDAWHGEYHTGKFLISAALMDRIQKRALAQGFTWAKPLGSSALIYLMIAKTGVEMAGYEMFQPLTDDLADMMYRGRIGPPKARADKFSAEDQARLTRLQRMLDENTAKIGDPAVALTPEQRRKIVEDSRGYRETIQELLKKKKAWEDYDKVVERWEAGIIHSGIKEQIDAPFDPILGPRVPLKFYLGSLDGDAGGPVDLEAKPLTDAERTRRENAILRLAGLRRAGGGLDPFDRVEMMCNLMDEIDDFNDREKAATRAQRYLERLRADENLLFEARRQNLCHLLNPLLDQRVPPPAGKDAAYWTAREKAAPGVVKDYVDKWFNEEHPQTRGIALLKDALPQVVARIQRDYEASDDARERFESYESNTLGARSDRRQRRRENLRALLVQQGVRNHVAAGREQSNILGLWTLAGNTPVADPVVKLSGAVVGEGADKILKVRVKVIASPFHFNEPYKFKFKNKVTERRADGAQTGGIVVEAFDADGKFIGADEVATVVEPLKATVEAANAMRDWPIPLKLVVTAPSADQVKTSSDELDIAAHLPGVPAGDYRLTAAIGDRSYRAHGKVERAAGTAFFKSRVAVPPGRSTVTLAVPNAPSVAFTVEKPVVPLGANQTAAVLKAPFTRAKDALAKAKNRPAKDADDEKRKQKEIEDAAGDAIRAARSAAENLFEARHYADAEAVLQEELALAPSDDYRRKANELLTAIAFRTGALQSCLTPARELFRLAKADLAATPTDQRKGKLDGIIRLYDRLIPYLLALGGSASDVKPLWTERAGYVNMLYGEDTVPEPHPDWGPE